MSPQRVVLREAGVYVHVAAAAEELDRCIAIRRTVFIEEQQVPEQHELDGLDSGSVHFLARRDGDWVGTARMRRLAGASEPAGGFEPTGGFKAAGGFEMKAERVAVLSAERGTGVGAVLMHALEAEAERAGALRVVLNAQEGAIAFYERLGYESSGDIFLEAGIRHLAMSKRLVQG